MTGLWKAHVHYAHVQQWYVFTLKIERRGGPDKDRLAGEIRSSWWHGDAAQQQPPPCSSGARRGTVYETARGTIDSSRRLVFNALSWKPERDECGLYEGPYLLDRFSGEIDPERQEFQSVLNADAPEWKDVPTVFRRIECIADQADHAPSAGPGIKVTPPPLIPSGKTRGSCDCTRPGR